MKYRILFETEVRVEMTEEADSYEAAVQKAVLRGPPVVAATRLRPTWVGTEDHLKTEEEFEYEILGPCGRCKTPIVSREVPGQPWSYGPDPANEHADMICYPCHQRLSVEKP